MSEITWLSHVNFLLFILLFLTSDDSGHDVVHDVVEHLPAPDVLARAHRAVCLHDNVVSVFIRQRLVRALCILGHGARLPVARDVERLGVGRQLLDLVRTVA